MLLILVLVVVVVVIVICVKPKGGATQERGNVPVNDQYPDNMAWPRPQPDNLWDSFDYFVRLGEVWARYADDIDENAVYLRYVVRDVKGYGQGKYAGARGYFELDMREPDWVSIRLPDAPYLQVIQSRFVGYDPSSKILTLEEQRIRSAIMDEAPHATGIRIQPHEIHENNGIGVIMDIDVYFRGLRSD